ncbi:hypothetical protein QBC34DRAFT_453462 [Podospora aff. communis PSN243]|uniref:SCA7 domain-containing protein n=1 Tax=Podospora aff. communis PSN243 TaxID=3040156 RepID=A0AAV9H526_9PEZI|nr:hypothetical protein QBC34DRAFT_453462 [Podospora aff. communis PSN243]
MATMESRKDEEATTIKVASAKNHPKVPINGILKVKMGGSKFNKPGAWKETGVLGAEEKKKTSKDKDGSIIAASSPDTVKNDLEEEPRETFINGHPVEDAPDLQQCKHCRKGVMGNGAKDHIATCLRIKKEKAQRKKEAREARERAKEAAREEEARKADADGDGRGEDDSDADDDIERKGPNAGKTTKKAAGKKTDSALSGKKRKAEGELDKGKAKKKKDEPKPKAAKPKGPVDVERQCGVTLPNGQPCARSLTCKSHSMGAKRSVPGRSLPYDMLLAAYQKKNQAKQQKAAIDANAPLEEEDDLNAGNVDSDEETAAVMSALAHWNPQPVVPQPVFEPIKSKYSSARFYEQMMAATNGGRINIFKVVGLGAQRIPENHTDALFDAEDALGEPDPAADAQLHGSSSPFGPAADDDAAPDTEPGKAMDDFPELNPGSTEPNTGPTELNTCSTGLEAGSTEPTEASKKRPMPEANDDSEPKQAKQTKRLKTGATTDTLTKPKQKAPRQKKAEVAVGNQAESALVATSKPSTTMPAPRRKKADAPAPKQINPSPSPIFKATMKSVARPNIFAIPPLPPLPPASRGSQHPSPAIRRDGEPALAKRSTSKGPTKASKKRQRQDARTSPTDGEGETHAKRPRVSRSPSQRSASAAQPSFHPTQAMEHPLPETSQPVPTKETGQLMANVKSHVKPAPYEASRLQARRISDYPSLQTFNGGPRPPSRYSIWSVRQESDTSESRPSCGNLSIGRERSMDPTSWPPPKQFGRQDAHPAQRQQQQPQVSHPKESVEESFRETTRELSFPRCQPSNNQRSSDASSQISAPIEFGSSPPRVDPIPPWRMRQVKSSPGVPPRPSPMKGPRSQQGRKAFSSPSAAKPLRQTLPPPPDSLPPRPPVPNDFKNHAAPKPSRRLSVTSSQGVRRPEAYGVAPVHQNANGILLHAAQVMSSPVGQASQPSFHTSGWTQPRYQAHPSAHQGMGMAGPASAPGWPQNHGYVPPGWSPHGQASFPHVPFVPSNGPAVYRPVAQQQHGPMMDMQAQQSYSPVIQNQAPHSQTIVAPWSQNHQPPPPPSGQAFGYTHGHPYGQDR